MHNPESVEVHGKKVWAEDILITPGGSATFVSTALASLGVPVKLLSSVGNDLTGQNMRVHFANAGIDCVGVEILPKVCTTKSMIRCTGEKKEFFGCSPMLPISLPSDSILDDVSIVYVAGYMLFPELWTDEAYQFFNEAVKRSIPLVIDGQCTGIDAVDLDMSTYDALYRLLSISSVYLAADKELRHLRTSYDEEGIAGNLLGKGLKTFVAKHGAKGCNVYSASGVSSAVSYPVDVYDSVGAGDIFGAGYTYGISQGWPSNQCAGFACAFAALSLKRYEKNKVYPSAKRARELLDQQDG